MSEKDKSLLSVTAKHGRNCVYIVVVLLLTFTMFIILIYNQFYNIIIIRETDTFNPSITIKM